MEIVVYREKEIERVFQRHLITIKSVSDAEELLKSVSEAGVLYIPVEGIDLSLVDQVLAINPRINLILVSDDARASFMGFKRHASGYLMRPYTETDVLDELNNIRYGEYSSLTIKCFGKFDLLINGVSMPFPRKKAKEFFALLVDHRGSTVSVDEICEALFNEVNDKKRRYIYVLKFELIKVLKNYNLEGIISNRNNGFIVDANSLDCDYFKFYNGQKDLFKGEYMSQYSWAKKTLKELEEVAGR